MVADTTIKKGYKQTEIGLIPDDWDVKELRDIVYFSNGKAHENFISDDGEYIVVNSKFISSEGKVVKYSKQCFSPASANSILMVMSDVPNGKAIAKCFLVDRDNQYTVNQRICALKPKIDARYLFYKINRNTYYLAFDDGVKQTNLRKDDVLDCKLSVPKVDAEQTAIAIVLSDTDTLIEHLEKLIIKKKNIKQGTMQQLLTGKKRLPGFSGAWVAKKLGEIFDFSGGYTASREQLSHNGFCYLHYGDIHGAKKTYIDVKKEFLEIPKLQVQLTKLSRKSILNDGDVVFVDASEDDEGTSRHVVIKNQNEIPFISGLHTIVAKSKDDSLDTDFKRYCFQSGNIKSQFKFYAVGTKVSGISKSNIAKIELFFPIKAEQTAIAAILSDMDAEIQCLEQKLDKYTMIKQGMMQQLLTGKIRIYANN